MQGRTRLLEAVVQLLRERRGQLAVGVLEQQGAHLRLPGLGDAGNHAAVRLRSGALPLLQPPPHGGLVLDVQLRLRGRGGVNGEVFVVATPPHVDALHALCRYGIQAGHQTDTVTKDWQSLRSHAGASLCAPGDAQVADAQVADVNVAADTWI